MNDATAAGTNLAAKVFGKVVRIEVVDVDCNWREVGRIYLGDRFINLEMVRDGFAWRYDKAGEFTDAERQAREKTLRALGGPDSGAAVGIP